MVSTSNKPGLTALVSIIVYLTIFSLFFLAERMIHWNLGYLPAKMCRVQRMDFATHGGMVLRPLIKKKKKSPVRWTNRPITEPVRCAGAWTFLPDAELL